MRFFVKIFIHVMVLALIFPLIIPSEKVLAATCKGITPITDPVALRMDQGEMVIWENVHPNLLSAKIKYEKLLKAKGWKIKYNSAYRPYQYQRHFYEIVTGVSSKCKRSERSKHELGPLVAKPSKKAPHTRGIAFDAIITDKNGKPLNGLHYVSASLLKVAKQAGLKFISTSRDGVHHELITTTVPKVTAKVPSPVQTTYLVKGKITYKTGLDVKNFPYNAAPKIGKVLLKENVEIAAKSGDWYKIKYGKGYGWIKRGTKNLTLLPYMPIISSLKINYDVNLYDQPTISLKQTRSIVPQTVKVMKKSENGWYLINTTLGAKWVYINPKPLKYLQVPKVAKLYSKPSASAKTSGKITPRKVKVFVDRGDGWYQISTSSGAKWIQITVR
ncbi:SH3 domain-containing protein [Bacillus sp. X1(2014)]|uniref:SH3 domain-containing protein n=1 Tax=Bacillus sp. X1(2014) TaxID=1565991 RepID=UPI00119D9A7A|nr:SH3 domain-containing protein [Bacillus sp. X1(2014)]